ncbi:hypothetical protein PLICRDRAFT_585169 [Plicaturopsis crispa FD-325 SS-3]|nr:hypothetical protein PLICRDRAFT_585169 [Plicaturopsis crispa FD-325 SS-3]
MGRLCRVSGIRDTCCGCRAEQEQTTSRSGASTIEQSAGLPTPRHRVRCRRPSAPGCHRRPSKTGQLMLTGEIYSYRAAFLGRNLSRGNENAHTRAKMKRDGRRNMGEKVVYTGACVYFWRRYASTCSVLGFAMEPVKTYTNSRTTPSCSLP